MKTLISIWENENRWWIKAIMILLFIPVLIWAAIKVWGSKFCWWLSNQIDDFADWLAN